METHSWLEAELSEVEDQDFEVFELGVLALLVDEDYDLDS